jgi:hypothetical protein
MKTQDICSTIFSQRHISYIEFMQSILAPCRIYVEPKFVEQPEFNRNSFKTFSDDVTAKLCWSGVPIWLWMNSQTRALESCRGWNLIYRAQLSPVPSYSISANSYNTVLSLLLVFSDLSAGSSHWSAWTSWVHWSQIAFFYAFTRTAKSTCTYSTELE